MHTFTQKPKATQQTTPAKGTNPGRAHFGQSREVNSIVHSQRSIGNQAVQRLFEGNTGNGKEDSSTTRIPRFGHDFSQVPIHPSASVGIQTKLAVSTPGDIYEQKADRVAYMVMHVPDRGTSRVARGEGDIEGIPLILGGQEKIVHGKAEVQRSRGLGADGPKLAPQSGARIQAMRGDGRALTSSERGFMEPRFGVDFSGIRIHTSQEADTHSRALHARAFTLGSDIFFRGGEYTPGKAESQRLLAHELTHTIQQGAASSLTGPMGVQGGCPPTVQREMKFEFQTKNKVFRNDGTQAVLLDRKYGPEDFLVKGSSGVTLESESHGVIEFETRWHRKWSKLKEEVAEAFLMTTQMKAAKAVSGGRKEFPFDVGGLRTGTAKELDQGKWDPKPDMEGKNEKILAKGEQLEVSISDPAWEAGIQSSESFELSEYESFLKQHEFPDYREPVIVSAQAILDKANTKKIAADKLVNLRNFLDIIVNYIKRGQGGPASDAAGAFADVEGMPAKQAFTLMSRTNFASMYKTLLSADEKKLFDSIVSGGIILTEMGLTKKSPFFIKGYGSESPQKGPTVNQWLSGITKGSDLLAHGTGPGLSAAMGRSSVETKAGQNDTRLVKFETRNRPLAAGGAFREPKDWEKYAHDLFKEAIKLRPRKTGKGETGLDDS